MKRIFLLFILFLLPACGEPPLPPLDENARGILLVKYAGQGDLKKVQELTGNYQVEASELNKSKAVPKVSVDFKLQEYDKIIVGDDSYVLPQGSTPLMTASQFGHLDVVKYLIENNANTELRDGDFGYTALMNAAINEENLNIVKYLIENGAYINFQGGSGDTALNIAAMQGNMTISKYLIENGADINAMSSHDFTPLMLALHRGDDTQETYLLVRYLVENGADVNQQSVQKGTALMSACEQGNLTVAMYLVESGADINIQTKRGNTALMNASLEGHLNIVTFLIKSGADVNIKNKSKKTALMQARNVDKNEAPEIEAVIAFLKQSAKKARKKSKRR